MRHTAFYYLSFLLSLLVTSPALAVDFRPSAGFFVENKGQLVDQNGATNPDVLFMATGPGFRVQLRTTGYSYELFSAEEVKGSVETVCTHARSLPSLRIFNHRVDVSFEGMNPAPTIVAEDAASETTAYYTNGAEIPGVRAYRRIIYKNIYPFTDVEFLPGIGKGPLKYNIILHPGADMEKIRFVLKGANGLTIEDGALVITTSQGTLTENIPLSYYTDSPETDRNIGLKLTGNQLSFTGQHDSGKTLVIDPSSNLIWSSYYSGWSLDLCADVASDSQDNVYMTGQTLSTNNIATAAAYQTVLAGNWDGFLVKFDPNGVRQWATYFGGLGLDQIYAMHIGKDDAIYVTGDTGSQGNIASQGAFQTVYGGGQDDMLLARFNTSGQRLWATYYGGSEHEFAQAVTTDAAGNVIIAGHTGGNNGGSLDLATSGAFSTTYNFMEDGVIVKFNSSGQRLWCTYYGDSGNDVVHSLATDAANNVYATGVTSSIAGISGGNAFQANPGGANDGFIACFNPSGSSLQWGTYYGGSSSDLGITIRVGNNGRIYLCGNTESTNNIASASAPQPQLYGGDDGFLASFDTDGNRIWASYFGGDGTDYINDMVLDAYSNPVFCGSSLSTNSIATTGAWQPSLASTNNYDAYFAKWSAAGQPRLGTYYGTADNELGYGVAIDRSGKVYLGGITSSTVGMATAAAHQTIGLGSGDCFIAKFCMDIEPAISPGPNSTLCMGTHTISTAAYATYSWSNSGETYNPIEINYSAPGTYTYSLYVTDGFGCAGGIDNFQYTIDNCYTSLQEEQLSSYLRISPVPASDQLVLHIEGQAVTKENLRIFSASGREMPVVQAQAQPLTLSVQHLSPGIYLLQARVNGKINYTKFVKD